jgi:hypothetical protein
MFAVMFDLGVAELLILAILGLLTVGVLVAVVLTVVLTTRGKSRDDSSDV